MTLGTAPEGKGVAGLSGYATAMIVCSPAPQLASSAVR